jgi:hypothetical protein
MILGGLALPGGAHPVAAETRHVATNGSDTSGDGTESNPFATITAALDASNGGDLILVREGLYEGRIQLRGVFDPPVTVRSEPRYRARLRHTATVITCYDGVGITVEGFDIAHSGPGAAPLVVQIQDLRTDPPGGADATRNITLRDNILHDSYNNDILKINNGARDIVVTGNLFANQTGSDEHIDINSVSNIVVEDNIFMNDFEGSGRTNGNDTSSYIVVKDSNGADDSYLGAETITIRRNIFLHWEGSTGSHFVLFGEDGQSFFEVRGGLVENCLMIGDSPNTMRAAVGVKGSRDITFRHNTIVGDLPALAYAMRINSEGANPPSEQVVFRANVWSDPTGTMGQTASGGSNDFSDTPPGEVASFVLDQNAYWNGGAALPFDAGEAVNVDDDARPLIGDPRLPAAAGVVRPRWDESSGQFTDGSTTIREAFVRLATNHGTPGADSPLVAAADPSHAPADDLLGNARDATPDLGAIERVATPLGGVVVR